MSCYSVKLIVNLCQIKLSVHSCLKLFELNLNLKVLVFANAKLHLTTKLTKLNSRLHLIDRIIYRKLPSNAAYYAKNVNVNFLNHLFKPRSTIAINLISFTIVSSILDTN